MKIKYRVEKLKKTEIHHTSFLKKKGSQNLVLEKYLIFSEDISDGASIFLWGRQAKKERKILITFRAV